MVAPEPAVSELPVARARRRGVRALRPHLPELAPDAPGGGIRVHGLRRHDAHAAGPVREPRPVRRAGVRMVAHRSRGVCDVRGSLAGAVGPPLLLRPHRGLAVPRDSSTEVHARGRGPPRSRNRGGPRHHLERDRDRRDARRALLRGARLAFRLTGAFFRGAFLARAFFAGALALFAGAFAPAFAAGGRTGPSIGISL